MFLKSVRDVLQEDEPEGNMFIFSRVHVTTHLIRRRPKLFLKAQIGAVVLGFFLCLYHEISPIDSVGWSSSFSQIHHLCERALSVEGWRLRPERLMVRRPRFFRCPTAVMEGGEPGF